MTESDSGRPAAEAGRTQESAGATRCPHCSGGHPATWSHCPRTGKPLTTGPALVGRIVGDRYRILGLIGEGGMGAVYEAEHLSVGRRVALKRLHPELATDAHAVSRFQREARAAGASGHEHVVDVLDLGFADDGAPYLVMELLAGESLATRLERVRQLAPQRAAAIAGQVLSALEAVHGLDVIHRDLKPDNIFLTRRHGRADYVKVLDFGVSKRNVEGQDPKLTRTGVMVGTPHYMSPEQARGVRTLDHRVDLYAVGVILYESLAGQLPFRADNYHALLQSILARDPLPLDTLVSDVDPRLVALVERALAKNPDDRFPSARAMWEALVPFGAETPTRGEPLAAPPPNSALGAPPTAPTDAEALQAKLGDAASLERLSPEGSPLLDPSPRAWNRVDAGRALVATSESWSDERGDIWRPASPPTSRAPTFALARGASAPTRPRSSTRSPLSSVSRSNTSAPTRVKGALVLTTREVVRGRHGTTLDATLIAELADSHREALDQVLLPMAWHRSEAFVAYLGALELARGTADGREARACGSRAAELELPRTHRLALRHATPATGLSRLPAVLRSYFEGPIVRVEESETGTLRLELEGAPDALGYYLTGFVEAFLELCGACDPRARVHAWPRGVRLSLRWR